jgi:tetratricopeptide (TPR) repeat protein
LYKLKKFEESQKQYLLAIKINPGHGDAYNNLANLYYLAKQYQKALDCLNRAEANGVKTNPPILHTREVPDGSKESTYLDLIGIKIYNTNTDINIR